MRPLQQEIIDDFHVKPEIDPETEIREIIDFMKTYVKHNPFIKSFVLGISGGQDSTLLGKMVQMAVDELNQEPGAAMHSMRSVCPTADRMMRRMRLMRSSSSARHTKQQSISSRVSMRGGIAAIGGI